MKRNHLSFISFTLLILFSLGFVNCGSPSEEEIEAIADFTAENAVEIDVTIQCGECVVFEDRSSGDIGFWLWDFEGGDPVERRTSFGTTTEFRWDFECQKK